MDVYDVQVERYAHNKICVNISARDGGNVYEIGCCLKQQFAGSVLGFSDDMSVAFVYTGIDLSRADEVRSKVEKFLK